MAGVLVDVLPVVVVNLRVAMVGAKMKIYVASSFLNKLSARLAMDMFEEAGHTIVADWTQHETSLEPAQLQHEAVEDLNGVADSDVLILLAPFRFSSAGEATAAMALKKIVIIVGATSEQLATMFLFAFYPGVILVDTVEEAIEVLRIKFKRRAGEK